MLLSLIPFYIQKKNQGSERELTLSSHWHRPAWLGLRGANERLGAELDRETRRQLHGPHRLCYGRDPHRTLSVIGEQTDGYALRKPHG